MTMMESSSSSMYSTSSRLAVLRLLEDSSSSSQNQTNSTLEFEKAEEEHNVDAKSSLTLNIVLIACLLLAYYVKKFKIYYLPESAGALLVGVVVGGIARATTNKLQLFEFVSST